MVFATVMVLGAIGLVVYFAVELLERLVIPWHASQNDRSGELGIT
jgi:NitT/TauT family transport system permease protein